MKRRASGNDEPVRTRILFHGLVGALAISGSMVLGESNVASQRAGALLLLFGGTLFATVVIVDSTRAYLRKRSNAPHAAPDPRSAARVRHETVVRRIRKKRPSSKLPGLADDSSRPTALTEWDQRQNEDQGQRPGTRIVQVEIAADEVTRPG